MSITYELFFQILNTFLFALIPIIFLVIPIILVLKKHKSTNSKIEQLEKRINDLENK